MENAKGDWTLFLKIGDHMYAPVEVKQLECIDPIYVAFFGKRYNRFKDPYHVKFDARDAEDKPLIQNSTVDVRLVFRTTKQEAQLVWNLEELKI